MSKLVERFIRYASRGTQSNEDNECCPSTPGQMALAEEIKADLEELGLEEITLDENGYLFASLPSNVDYDVPTIGFISHMDTAPDSSGEGVKPRIVDYTGGVITLNEELGIKLDPQEFPELLSFVGKQLIVTDGTTLLGADDKAGVAEIIAAVEHLKNHPEIKHGKVRIGFNPDEEIGRGAAKFDVEKFAADWAYTMDGGPEGELQFENFNAATATIEFTGRVVHPGTAKGKMVNAILVANEFVAMLPADEVPAKTDGYEGFYHLISFEGSVGKTKLTYILRDHDREKFEHKKAEIMRLTEEINKKYPGCAVAKVTDSYFNMREKIEPVMHVIDLAKMAMLNVDVKPIVEPIRGGTDGAQLSFKGLPCPNIFAGGMNMHGIYEYVSIATMEKAVATIVEICRLAALK